jgi:hypothetical protein
MLGATISRLAISELLANYISLPIQPIQGDFETHPRQVGGGVHREETAGVMVDVSAFVGVGDDGIGRERTAQSAEGC